jgi:hypothetical protein
LAQLMTELTSSHEEQQSRSAVERIAALVAAAQQKQLIPDVRKLFKRNILDSISCAIAVLPGKPFHAMREQFEEYRAPGRCTLIAGGKTSPDQAALFNSSIVRYVDLLDGYMSPGGLDQPMSWDRVIEKFHWLSEAFADEDLRNKLIQPVQQLDVRSISDLMDLRAQVQPTAVFPNNTSRH